jgi:hypothetical protein
VFTAELWSITAAAAAAAVAAMVLLPGHLTCVKLLLEEGANIEQRNVVGALLWFVIVLLLLQMPA